MRMPQAVSRLAKAKGLGAGLQAAAEVRMPQAANFAGGAARGALRRLLVLEGVQDPGNLVRC